MSRGGRPGTCFSLAIPTYLTKFKSVFLIRYFRNWQSANSLRLASEEIFPSFVSRTLIRLVVADVRCRIRFLFTFYASCAIHGKQVRKFCCISLIRDKYVRCAPVLVSGFAAVCFAHLSNASASCRCAGTINFTLKFGS